MERGPKTSFSCARCGIAFLGSPEDAAQHFLGKRHKSSYWSKSVTAADRDKEDANSVFVPNFGPLAVSQLLEHLVQFGHICNFVLGGNKQAEAEGRGFAIVQFADSASATSAIKAKHVVSKVVFYVKAKTKSRRPPRVRPPTPELKDKVKTDEVVEAVANANDNVSDQMVAVAAVSLLRPEDVRERNAICAYLETTFRRHLKLSDCSVTAFGSTRNGLGFRGCDLDVYVEMNVLENQLRNKPSDDELKADPKMLDRWLQTEKVRLVTNALRVGDAKNYVAKVQPIPKARVPIVKMIHKETGINCDLSFRNRMSVLNSSFITSAIELDPRVKPLMVTLRYWAKACGVADGGLGRSMTSYAFSLLVIFYLQQLKPPVLPSVWELQQLPDFVSTPVDGWECGFSTSAGKPSENVSTLEDLLKGFFTFYASFPMTTQVISPLLGATIPKDAFGETGSNLMPEAMELYLRRSREDGQNVSPLQTSKVALCLQDPFELNRNVTLRWPEQSANDFMDLCEEASKTLERQHEALTVSDKVQEDRFNICDLWEKVPLLVKEAKSTKIHSRGKYNEIVLNYDRRYASRLSDMEMDFCVLVKCLVYKIFKKCLLFEVDECTNANATEAENDTCAQLAPLPDCDPKVEEVQPASDAAAVKQGVVVHPENAPPHSDAADRAKKTDERVQEGARHNDEDIQKHSEKLAAILRTWRSKAAILRQRRQKEAKGGESNSDTQSKEEPVKNPLMDEILKIQHSEPGPKAQKRTLSSCDSSPPSSQSEPQGKAMKKQETAREMDSWLECRAFAPTWECRRKGKKEMEKRSGGEILGHCFDREAALSMYLVEEVFGKVKCPQPDIVFKVLFLDYPDEYVVVDLRPTSSRGQKFQSLCNFLRHFVPNLVRRALLDENRL